MQLARLSRPGPRTFARKAAEAFAAIKIDVTNSKRDILQYYLSRTPYGGNIEGVVAASHIYFGHPPQHLSLAQSALLIAIPQAPEARRPDRNAADAKAARDQIIKKLYAGGHISALARDEAISEPVPMKRQSFPRNAWLTGQNLQGDQFGHIHSSLDPRLQRSGEGIATQSASGPYNVAIVAVRNADGRAVVQIGSAGTARAGGWIDMTRAARSPGSALKPFIYGLAFDDGAAAPGSLLRDEPIRIGDYQPENFDRKFYGNVTASEALAHSLNVPAVKTLEKIGSARFAAALENSGVPARTRSNQNAGLALALGGAGVTMRELAVLYHGLSQGGRTRSLLFAGEQKHGTSQQLLSPQSAEKITKILKQAPTPAGHLPHWLKEGSAAIAYKTGTSYGFRDAIAAGYSDEWTVIVWTGRPNGAPSPGRTGRSHAAPIMFDMFALLPHTVHGHIYQKTTAPPRGITENTVSGGPVILFPQSGTEIGLSDFSTSGDGVRLDVQGEHGPFNWFVDGAALPKGSDTWYPERPGFYQLSVVDARGKIRSVNVRLVKFSQ